MGSAPTAAPTAAGTLAFACAHDGAPVAGDLVLDCGGITLDERAQLDANRQELRDRQRLAPTSTAPVSFPR